MAEIQMETKFHAPYQAWKKEPTPVTTGALLRSLGGIMDTGLRTYGGPNPSPLLKSRARRLVLDSLPRYDPTRTKLSTFLMQQLQSLRRARFEEQEPIRIPEQVRLDRGHLDTAEKELRDRLGRDPSTPELSDMTHLSPARIAKIRTAHGGLAEGSMTRYSDADEGVYSPAVQQRNDEPWLQFVHSSLHPTDQLILEHSTGLHGRPQISNNAIAKKLGVTPSAVSQRRTKIQAKLDSREDLGVF